jgi:hypothetical protein
VTGGRNRIVRAVVKPAGWESDDETQAFAGELRLPHEMDSNSAMADFSTVSAMALRAPVDWCKVAKAIKDMPHTCGCRCGSGDRGAGNTLLTSLCNSGAPDYLVRYVLFRTPACLLGAQQRESE